MKIASNASKAPLKIKPQILLRHLDAFIEQAPVSACIVDAKGQNLLSRRQKEIVALVADGRSNREISQALHLSEHTVKNYILRIFDKLGLSNRVELIMYVVTRFGIGIEQHKQLQETLLQPEG